MFPPDRKYDVVRNVALSFVIIIIYVWLIHFYKYWPSFWADNTNQPKTDAVHVLAYAPAMCIKRIAGI